MNISIPNRINTQEIADNNIIAAKKLSDRQTGSRENMGLINLPETQYRYSSDEYVKKMQKIKQEAIEEHYVKEDRNKRIKYLLSLISASIFTFLVYLGIKNFNMKKIINVFCKK